MAEEISVILIPCLRKAEEEGKAYHQRERKMIDASFQSYLDRRQIKIEERSIAKGEHGKPYLKDHPELHYNLSHCEGLAAIAFSGFPIGIDVEGDRKVGERLYQKVSDDTELREIQSARDSRRRMIQYWTLKESYVKAIGMGLSFPLDQIHIRSRGEESWDAHGELVLPKDELLYLQLDFKQDRNEICCADQTAFFYHQMVLLDGKHFYLSLCGILTEKLS